MRKRPKGRVLYSAHGVVKTAKRGCSQYTGPMGKGYCCQNGERYIQFHSSKPSKRSRLVLRGREKKNGEKRVRAYKNPVVVAKRKSYVLSAKWEEEWVKKRGRLNTVPMGTTYCDSRGSEERPYGSVRHFPGSQNH